MLTRTDDTPHTEAGTTPPVGALAFDPAKYRAEVDCFDLTEAQKQELLATLWAIMRSFVELGFNVDVCGAVLGGFAPAGDGEESA